MRDLPQWVKTGSALVEHKISASSPKPDICALMSNALVGALARNLLLLGILSGFCAVFAWSLDYPIWASVFLAFCLAAFQQ
jgi:hypothetical protein